MNGNIHLNFMGQEICSLFDILAPQLRQERTRRVGIQAGIKPQRVPALHWNFCLVLPEPDTAFLCGLGTAHVGKFHIPSSQRDPVQGWNSASSDFKCKMGLSIFMVCPFPSRHFCRGVIINIFVARIGTFRMKHFRILNVSSLRCDIWIVAALGLGDWMGQMLIKLLLSWYTMRINELGDWQLQLVLIIDWPQVH